MEFIFIFSGFTVLFFILTQAERKQHGAASFLPAVSFYTKRSPFGK